jgi:ElaB/YqjD/DUF883 family membrane-anchored ribosome-binding protein
MADKTSCSAKHGGSKEFLTNVDESLPVSREDEDTPTRRRRRIQEGLRGRGSEDEETRRRQTCVFTDGYDDETDGANTGAYVAAYTSANMNVYATANVSVYTTANTTGYMTANTTAYTTAYMGANTSAYTTAYMGANTGAYVAAYTSANMNANVGAYTDEKVGAYTRIAHYEDTSVDTVRRRLYSSRDEQDEINLPDIEDDTRMMMFRSRSEPIPASATRTTRRPTTLEMDERLAARGSSNGSFTRKNGLSKFRGSRMIDLPVSPRIAYLTTATTTVTTASTRPKMSLVSIDQRCGSSKEIRMTRSAPDSETRDGQEKEVRSGTGRKDDDYRSGDETKPTKRMKTYLPLDEDRCTMEEQIEHSVNQAILRCRTEADEEEEKRKRQAHEELEGVRRSFEQEMERRAWTSREAIERADEIIVEQAQTMSRRVEEMSRQAERDCQTLEYEQRREQEENR